MALVGWEMGYGTIVQQTLHAQLVNAVNGDRTQRDGTFPGSIAGHKTSVPYMSGPHAVLTRFSLFGKAKVWPPVSGLDT